MDMQNIPATIQSLGVKRIAEKLSVPYTTVHYWVTAGKVPHWRMADAIRAVHAALQEDELNKLASKAGQSKYAEGRKAKGAAA